MFLFEQRRLCSAVILRVLVTLRIQETPKGAVYSVGLSLMILYLHTHTHIHLLLPCFINGGLHMAGSPVGHGRSNIF